MSLIHPSAIVDSTAQLGPGVAVGPFAIVGPGVVLGEGCRIHAHGQVLGGAVLGPFNEVFSHAVIGNPPQDKKYKGEPTRLEIGAHNTFRECVTVNLGTVQDGGVTRIADHNWIMAYVHIAHDCQVGSNTIMANAVQLAGHVQVGYWAIIGGITGVHQFVRIGAHAMTGAGTTLLQDLPTSWPMAIPHHPTASTPRGSSAADFQRVPCGRCAAPTSCSTNRGLAWPRHWKPFEPIAQTAPRPTPWR